jgi:hypothetical protein
MKDGRKKITKEMLEVGAERGMNVTQVARYYGLHRKSVDAACERLGVMLPFSIYSPQKPTASKLPTIKPKTKAVWSAKPVAIRRAARKLGIELPKAYC